MKIKSIPLDDVHVEVFRDPKVADCAVKLALQDFERDNNVEILLDTLRLVAQAQVSLAEPASRR